MIIENQDEDDSDEDWKVVKSQGPCSVARHLPLPIRPLQRVLLTTNK